MQDEETLTFGRRELRFLHTRGHANHHFCIADSASRVDLHRRCLRADLPGAAGHGTFALPSTSPTDFEPALAREAVKRLVGRAPVLPVPDALRRGDDIDGSAGQLLRHLDFAEACATMPRGATCRTRGWPTTAARASATTCVACSTASRPLAATRRPGR
jgi:hypothetical protein